jgi:ABC-type multidrug transport system ATPase subunit
MAELGIMLEARAVHTGRSARSHLLALAQTNGVPAKRVSEVIDMVGLAEVDAKRVGGFSLGMGQAPLWQPDTKPKPTDLKKIGIYAAVAAKN